MKSGQRSLEVTATIRSTDYGNRISVAASKALPVVMSPSIRTLAIYLFGLSTTALGQHFSVGLLGGASLTQDFQIVAIPYTGGGAILDYSTPRRWIAGAIAEVQLPLHLALEVDGLYHELGITSAEREPKWNALQCVAGRHSNLGIPGISEIPAPAHREAGAVCRSRTNLPHCWKHKFCDTLSSRSGSRRGRGSTVMEAPNDPTGSLYALGGRIQYVNNRRCHCAKSGRGPRRHHILITRAATLWNVRAQNRLLAHVSENVCTYLQPLTEPRP